MRVGVRYVAPLVLALLALGWAATAYAQDSANAQYGSPTASPSGNPAAAGKAGGGGASKAGGVSTSGGGSGGGSGGAQKGGGGAKVKVLPATGGISLLPVVALGAVALGATGVLVLRRSGSR